MPDSYAITERAGLVHRIREGRSCNAFATAQRRRAITVNQAWVYKLPYCPACWNAVAYAHVLNRSASAEADQEWAPAYACRQMPTRHCPISYGAVCGDRPCARYESEDERPWLAELPDRGEPS